MEFLLYIGVKNGLSTKDGSKPSKSNSESTVLIVSVEVEE